MADDSDVGSIQSETNGQKIDRICSYYSLYTFHTNRRSTSSVSDDAKRDDEADTETGTSLSVLSTDLDAAAETELRKYLCQRLTKGTLYAGTGSISTLDICLSPDSESASCYYSLWEHADPMLSEDKTSDAKARSIIRKYVVCFLSSSETSLEQFRPELDRYGEGVLPFLDAEPYVKALRSCQNSAELSQKAELSQINTAVKEYLQCWHDVAMDYICRCVSRLHGELQYVIHAALEDAELQVEGVDERLKEDIKMFYQNCSLSDLIEKLDSPNNNKSLLDVSDAVLVDLSEGDECKNDRFIVAIGEDSVRCSLKNSTKFCDDWATALSTGDAHNAVYLRQILEMYKLKCIQNMNTLKRLLIQAENDHYALYRAFVFLKTSGNGPILLAYCKMESQLETDDVFKPLEEFIEETKVFC